MTDDDAWGEGVKNGDFLDDVICERSLNALSIKRSFLGLHIEIKTIVLPVCYQNSLFIS